MKYKEAIGVTTHQDRSGEKLTKHDLELLLEDSHGRMIPILYEHDQARPPVGRQLRLELRKLEDKEWCLVGILQIWEPGDPHPGPGPDGSLIQIREYPKDRNVVSIDESLEGPDFLDELADFERLGFTIERERRKSFVLGSILVVGFGLVAAGFFGEIGKDLWSGLKGVIKRVRKKNPEAAKRVVFSVTVQGQRTVETSIILDGPTDENLDALFDRGFAQIERSLAKILESPDVAKVVFRGDTDGFPVEFTVDQHGFPSRVDAIDWDAIGGASINYARVTNPDSVDQELQQRLGN